MAKLIFKYTDDDYIEHAREASEIEFTIPDELNIFGNYLAKCLLCLSMRWKKDDSGVLFHDLDNQPTRCRGGKVNLGVIVV